MTVAVGVDLGSTHCNVGIWRNSRPEIIANHHGLRSTPTMVAYADKEVLVGEAALTQIGKNQANTVYGFKWMVGVENANLEEHVKELIESAAFKVVAKEGGGPLVKVQVAGQDKEVTAEELCIILFKHLRSIAEQFSGDKIATCVLSVPAAFSEVQRTALAACGKSAGLPFSCILSDPVAAAIAYGLDRPDTEIQATARDEAHASAKNTIVVVDWGGGGVEAAVLKRVDGVLSLASTVADTSAGGSKFIRKLVEFCAKDFKRKTGGDVLGSKKAVLKLTRACEAAVKTLSLSGQADIYVEALYEGCDCSTKISRRRFEDLCFDLYKVGPRVCQQALAQAAGNGESAVDMVLLAGGVGQMPKVQEVIKAAFPGGTLFGTGLFTDEAVVIGATVQAGLLHEKPLSKSRKGKNTTNMESLPRMLHVLPSSIGIRCVGEQQAPAEEALAGERNTLIVAPQGGLLPVSATGSLRVERPGKGALELEVVEVGTDGSTSILGHIVFPSLGAGAECEVAVSIQVDGTVMVHAREETTGELQQLTISNNILVS